MDLLDLLKKERKLILYSLLGGLIFLYSFSKFKKSFMFPGLEYRVLFALILVILVIVLDFLFTSSFFKKIKKLRKLTRGKFKSLLKFFTLRNALFSIFTVLLLITLFSFLKLNFFLSNFLDNVQILLILATIILWTIIHFSGRKK